MPDQTQPCPKPVRGDQKGWFGQELDPVRIEPGQALDRLWTGFVLLGEQYQLNYWFFEAVHDKENSPLILWLNGGPGCSSLTGLLVENGPFRFSNILYLEAPAGVGFSYTQNGFVGTEDDLVSLNNYYALLSFLRKFPEYYNRDFYISGESYAGVYVPTLALRVVADRANGLNLKGIAVGNPLVDYDLNTDSLLYLLYYHGFVDQQVWDYALEACCGTTCTTRCRFSQSDNSRCEDAISYIRNIIFTLGYYNMYSRCTEVTLDGSLLKVEKMPFLPFEEKLRKPIDIKRLLKSNPRSPSNSRSQQPRRWNEYMGANDAPCELDAWMVAYLNQQDVREALNINNASAADWKQCNRDVSRKYGRTYTNLAKEYVGVLDSGVEVLLYAGDVDLAVNMLGLQWFINELPVESIDKLQQWYYTAEDETIQVGGMYQRSSRGNNTLHYATVRGSGHFVPTDRPVASYEMITRFVWGVSGTRGV